MSEHVAIYYWAFTQQLRQSGETSLPVPKFLKRPHCSDDIGVNPRVPSEGYISAEVPNNPTQPSLTSISLRSFLQPTIASRSPPPSPHALSISLIFLSPFLSTRLRIPEPSFSIKDVSFRIFGACLPCFRGFSRYLIALRPQIHRSKP